MFLSLQMTRTIHFGTFVILSMAGTLVFGNQMESCSTWYSDNDTLNNLDASVSLWERNNQTINDCVIRCDRAPSCRSFFHHPTNETCLASSSYKRGLPTDKAGQQGWVYYTKKQYCDNGYTFNQSLDLCYKFYRANQTFNNAMMLCEADGAKLAIIKDEATFRLMNQVTSGAVTFIGLRAMGVNREWTWWNGQLASYMAWNFNQPDNWNGLENCVIFYTQYADVYCTSLGYFICQKFV
ncbi:hypothetical protein ACJMK2_000466 [Sinanodonta woodiana]|uniref:Uncharacterized protein n=1 Tax=Sinanodonta woodiana TaxID=1069815 RepID=A0ABD3XSW7_SINWO